MEIALVFVFVLALVAIVFLRCPKSKGEESFVGPKWYKRKNLTARWD